MHPFPLLCVAHQIVLPSLCNTGGDSIIESHSHVDPNVAELCTLPWSRYQRCLHVVVGVLALAYVPTAIAVFSALSCHTSDVDVVLAELCSSTTRTSATTLAVVFLVFVVVGVPVVVAIKLLCEDGRSRFRDVAFWRRYGMLYALFTDKRYVLVGPASCVCCLRVPGGASTMRRGHVFACRNGWAVAAVGAYCLCLTF